MTVVFMVVNTFPAKSYNHFSGWLLYHRCITATYQWVIETMRQSAFAEP